MCARTRTYAAEKAGRNDAAGARVDRACGRTFVKVGGKAAFEETWVDGELAKEWTGVVKGKGPKRSLVFLTPSLSNMSTSVDRQGNHLI